MTLSKRKDWCTRPDSNGRPADSKSSCHLSVLFTNPHKIRTSSKTPISKSDRFTLRLVGVRDESGTPYFFPSELFVCQTAVHP